MAYSNEAFGHRLMVTRKDRRMNQDDLSQASGVDKNSIARYETGGTTPGLDKAYAMAVALGCSIDELAELPAPEDRK